MPSLSAYHLTWVSLTLDLSISSWLLQQSAAAAPYGETMETVADFIFLGSKITADDDCSHEIKRRLLLGRKVMTNLDSTL